MALAALEHLTDEQQACIDTCYETVQTCEWCADACAGEGEEMSTCLRLWRDVVGVASLLIQYIARDSNYTPELVEVCTGAAEQCAEECERHDAEHCQVCADVLSECAESCRNTMSTLS